MSQTSLRISSSLEVKVKPSLLEEVEENIFQVLK
jgi:hypothetical protein